MNKYFLLIVFFACSLHAIKEKDGPHWGTMTLGDNKIIEKHLIRSHRKKRKIKIRKRKKPIDVVMDDPDIQAKQASQPTRTSRILSALTPAGVVDHNRWLAGSRK